MCEFAYVCVCICMVRTKFGGQDSQSVALDVKLFEVSQLTYFLWQRDQIIIPQTQLDKRNKKTKEKQETLF